MVLVCSLDARSALVLESPKLEHWIRRSETAFDLERENFTLTGMNWRLKATLSSAQGVLRGCGPATNRGLFQGRMVFCSLRARTLRMGASPTARGAQTPLWWVRDL